MTLKTAQMAKLNFQTLISSYFKSTSEVLPNPVIANKNRGEILKTNIEYFGKQPNFWST